MADVSEHRTVAERFADLLREMEQTDAYHIDGAKVEISEQIYLAMEQQGVSEAELARRLGKSRAYVTRVLQGNADFNLGSLVKIARALSCKFDLRLTPGTPAEGTK